MASAPSPRLPQDAAAGGWQERLAARFRSEGLPYLWLHGPTIAGPGWYLDPTGGGSGGLAWGSRRRAVHWAASIVCWSVAAGSGWLLVAVGAWPVAVVFAALFALPPLAMLSYRESWSAHSGLLRRGGRGGGRDWVVEADGCVRVRELHVSPGDIRTEGWGSFAVDVACGDGWVRAAETAQQEAAVAFAERLAAALRVPAATEPSQHGEAGGQGS